MKKNLQKINNSRAFVILFAVTVSAIILAVALGISNIALKEIKFGTSAKDTNNAFFATNTGVECALFNDKSPTKFVPSPQIQNPINCGGNSLNVSRSTSGLGYIFDFTVFGLGDDEAGCAKVTVDKSDPSKTIITSSGYNTGNDACGSTNPDRIERRLIVSDESPASPPPSNMPSGGDETIDGFYTIHTFFSSGTFNPGNMVSSVEVLVVAGGGSGGGSTAGGGGAGGLIHNGGYTVSNQDYPVTVGQGGAQSSQQTSGSNGGNSIFGTLTAVGGGGGGFTFPSGGGPGLDGGSGGGGARYDDRTFIGGTGTPSQGNNGGTFGTNIFPGGGGGGAGGPGANPTVSKSGNGGVGRQNPITGSTTGQDNGSGIYYLAGGGGGGASGSSGDGGIGGGGAGTSSTGPSVAGTPNTGGGGGGGWPYIGGIGGAGGSGVVIIRYLTPIP